MNCDVIKLDKEYSCSVINDCDEFIKQRDMWNSLLNNNEEHAPWLCWDWFDLCLKYFSNYSKLHIVIIYRLGKVEGIAPFVMRDEKYKGLLRVRKIELIGNSYSQ